LPEEHCYFSSKTVFRSHVTLQPRKSAVQEYGLVSVCSARIKETRRHAVQQDRTIGASMVGRWHPTLTCQFDPLEVFHVLYVTTFRPTCQCVTCHLTTRRKPAQLSAMTHTYVTLLLAGMYELLTEGFTVEEPEDLELLGYVRTFLTQEGLLD
jgi:hypothetical protein